MNDKEFIQIVEKCETMALASKKTHMAYTSFIRKAKRLNCYKPNQGRRGIKKPSDRKIPLSEILEGKHPQYQSYKLKIRLIQENILKDECSICGWNKKSNGQKFTSCELDHIDGNPLNHKLENLHILCPNCHSLTKTYRFRRGKANGNEHQETKVLDE